MEDYQYGLKPGTPYPTKKEGCGCVRINPPNDGPVIDYCQRHVLNRIREELSQISGAISDVATAIVDHDENAKS